MIGFYGILGMQIRETTSNLLNTLVSSKQPRLQWLFTVISTTGRWISKVDWKRVL